MTTLHVVKIVLEVLVGIVVGIAVRGYGLYKLLDRMMNWEGWK